MPLTDQGHDAPKAVQIRRSTGTMTRTPRDPQIRRAVMDASVGPHWRRGWHGPSEHLVAHVTGRPQGRRVDPSYEGDRESTRPGKGLGANPQRGSRTMIASSRRG